MAALLGGDTLSLKAKGNAAFQRGDFKTAEQMYTSALEEAVHERHILFSNRAAALLSQSESATDASVRADLLNRAAADVLQCTSQAAGFRRGWIRLAKIRLKQRQIADACAAVETGRAKQTRQAGTPCSYIVALPGRSFLFRESACE